MPAETFGALSVVPPLLAIVLAVVTRKPILSLFLGVWSGGIVYVYSESVELASSFLDGLGLAFDPLAILVAVPIAGIWGFVQTLAWVTGSIASDFNAQILAIVMFLGAGVALIWKLGGALAIANFATKGLDNQRKTGVATWIFGMLWFFGDYSNTAIVGTTMRDVADEVRISREKLSYIVDSTAAPVATFGISSWVVYQLSMIREGYASAGIEVGADAPSAFVVFLRSIPFNMYCLLAVAMVGIIIISQRDFGEMLDAEHRSWQTGKVNRDNATPLQSAEESLGSVDVENPQLRMFIVPVATLIAIVGIGAFWTGYEPGAEGLLDIVDGAEFTLALVWASFGMVAAGLIMARVYDVLSLEDSMDSVIDGFGMMLTAASILIMAWSIGTVATDLGTGQYVTNIAEGLITPTLLPVVILFASAFIAFSTGTSWGTMAIVTPIAIPLAWNIGGQTPELLPVAVGTIFSGAIFGDHTSPISDTTILSSTFTGADVIDHVRTQMYYATTVVSVATVLLLIYGATGVSPFVLLPIGVVTLVGLVYALSEFDAKRKNLQPKASRTAREETPADD